MKYIAIIDEASLTKQEIENLFMLARDQRGKAYKVPLTPLLTPTLTNTFGDSVCLNQKHVDLLLEYEKNEIMRKIAGGMESGIRFLGREN